MKRLLDFDPVTGTKTFHSYDYDTDTTIIETETDLEPVLEFNKALQKHDRGRVIAGSPHFNAYEAAGIENEWFHAARIPNPIIEKWLIEDGIDVFKWGKCDWTTRKIKQRLNSPEWKYLRTGNATI